MDNLERNHWNMVLVRSDMKGIFRSVWIVWFDSYQAASRMDRRTLDWNLWMQTMLETFADPYTFIAYVEGGRRIILYTVSWLSRENLDLLLRRGLRRSNFLLRSVRFSLVWGLQIIIILKLIYFILLTQCKSSSGVPPTTNSITDSIHTQIH
jgi:hypothetical protein